MDDRRAGQSGRSEIAANPILVGLEGPKGVGKTTVMTALRERLRDTEVQVVLTKEPTGKFDLTQETCLSGPELARAIAADRALHVAEVIVPALEAGTAVICDRYILSSLVFHSIDGVPPEEIWRLNATFPLPDVNLVLTASETIIRNRRDARLMPTRLEWASPPMTEQEEYARFGKIMQQRGSKLHVLSNETPEELTRVLEWITCTIQQGIQL
jgi:dTMP kinase